MCVPPRDRRGLATLWGDRVHQAELTGAGRRMLRDRGALSPLVSPPSMGTSPGFGDRSSPGFGERSPGGSMPWTFSYHSPEDVLELSVGSGSAGGTGGDSTGAGTLAAAGRTGGSRVAHWCLLSLLTPPGVLHPLGSLHPRSCPHGCPHPLLLSLECLLLFQGLSPSLLTSLGSLHPCSHL